MLEYSSSDDSMTRLVNEKPHELQFFPTRQACATTVKFTKKKPHEIVSFCSTVRGLGVRGSCLCKAVSCVAAAATRGDPSLLQNFFNSLPPNERIAFLAPVQPLRDIYLLLPTWLLHISTCLCSHTRLLMANSRANIIPVTGSNLKYPPPFTFLFNATRINEGDMHKITINVHRTTA